MGYDTNWLLYEKGYMNILDTVNSDVTGSGANAPWRKPDFSLPQLLWPFMLFPDAELLILIRLRLRNGTFEK